MKKALALASAFFEQKSSLWLRQHALVLIALATLALLLCYRATDTRYQFKQGQKLKPQFRYIACLVSAPMAQ